MPGVSSTDLIVNDDGSVFHLGLVPGQVADDIIAVGDPARVAEVSQYFDTIDSKCQRREFVTHTGTFQGKRLTVISSGIGPDNVEIVLNELDALVNMDLKTRVPKEQHHPLRIVRIGTSGSLQSEIAVGSHLLSLTAVGLDNLMNFYKLPQDDTEKSICSKVVAQTGINFMPYKVASSPILNKKFVDGMVEGNTVTCPGFYAPQGRQVRLPIQYPQLLDKLTAFRADRFMLTNFEMETSAYFAFGRLMGHEMASVNAILANRVDGKMAHDPGRVVDDLIRKVLERI